MSGDKPLFEGNAVTIWAEYLENEESGKKELVITVRVGMTTMQIPHSVFLELDAGTDEVMKKLEAKEKLT